MGIGGDMRARLVGILMVTCLFRTAQDESEIRLLRKGFIRRGSNSKMMAVPIPAAKSHVK